MQGLVIANNMDFKSIQGLIWLLLNLIILNRFKGTISCFTVDILTKLYINSHVILIHIFFTFHEVLIIVGYIS